MATKMTAETAKRVKNLNINAKNEEEARKSLLAILNENGIEGMEDEDTATLIEIAESFVEEGSAVSETEDEEPVETTDDDDAAALAEEVEAEVEAKDNQEDNDDEPEAEDDSNDPLAEMDRTALKAYIKENSLAVKVKKSWSDDDIREAIRTVEASIQDNETEDQEPEAEDTPAPKKVEKKAKATKKTEEEGEKKIGKRGLKLDPKNNEDDRAEFESFKELFPEDEYAYAWVASAGVTIKHIGKNSQRAMLLIENCSKQADGSVKCNLYLPTFTKQTDVLDEAGIEYEKCWSGAPFIKGTTMSESIELIKSLMPHITATVQKIDKRLGENRAKMEESLNKKAAKTSKSKK